MARGLAGDVVAVRIVPAPRIAIGGAEEHQHLLALPDRGSGEFDLARGGAEEGLHRALEPHCFLEGVAGQRRIGAQPRELVRKTRQAVHRRSNAVDGGVEARREQRPHQQRGLLGRDLAGVAEGVDTGAETARREVRPLALLGHIGLMRRRAFDRALPQFVRRPERVEHETRIGQQILAPLLLQAHRIGKHRQRIGFGEVGNRIDIAAAGQQFIDLGVRRRREAVTQPLHRRRRQHLAEHRAGAGMRRRVGLEDQARRPPRLLLLEIAQANAAAGAEGERIVEHRINFGVAGDAIDVPLVEIHHRARLAQRLLLRIGIGEVVQRERIDTQMRNTRAVLGRRGNRHR